MGERKSGRKKKKRRKRKKQQRKESIEWKKALQGFTSYCRQTCLGKYLHTGRYLFVRLGMCIHVGLYECRPNDHNVTRQTMFPLSNVAKKNINKIGTYF